MGKVFSNITKKRIFTFVFTLYLICFSSYNLNKGFDDYVIKIIPVALLLITFVLFYNKIKITKLLIWFTIFWSYYNVSSIWAMNIDYVKALNPHILYLLPAVFSLPYLIEDENDIQNVLKCVVISLLYSLVLLLIRGGFSQLGSERIGSAIGLSPNAVGIRFAIGALICLYLLHEDKKNKNLNIFLVLLFLVFGLLTGSRKAAIMIVVGIPSYEILISKGSVFFLKCVLAIFIVFIMSYLIFNNKYLYNVLGNRFDTMLSQIGNAEKIDGSVYERNFYREQAIGLFKTKPIIGVGGNNFAAYMSYIRYKHVAYSHNNFAELLSTLGIIGFAIYYYAWGRVLIEIVKDFNKNKKNLNLFFLIIIGLLILMDYGKVSYYDVFTILMLSICHSYVSQNKKNINEERKSA